MGEELKDKEGYIKCKIVEDKLVCTFSRRPNVPCAELIWYLGSKDITITSEGGYSTIIPHSINNKEVTLKLKNCP